MALSSAVMWVYILRCSNNTLYVGQTLNLEERERIHNAGEGPSYTADRRPIRVVYSEFCDSRQRARRREEQIKRWSAEKKEALIAGDFARLYSLSRRRQLKGHVSS
jgi:predicted GIY-YIG superfamily endonuclease